MKVLFLVLYPKQAPSPRYRVYNLVPWLERAGIECDVRSLVSEGDYQLSRRKGHYVRKTWMLTKGFLKRLWTFRHLKSYDAVYVLKSSFPYGPPIFERWVHRSTVPLIFDFDDAIQIHKPSGNHRLLDFLKPASRTTQVVTMADLVVVPNRFLADFAQEHNTYVQVVPEAEDTEKLTPRGPHTNDKDSLIIGWVGSASTAKYLHLISDALKEICDKYPHVTIRVIGGHYEAAGVKVEHVPWSFEKETQQFHELDIGIMPLPLEEWSKGKSGCKLRQYMATGVPGIGTRIGYNCELVQDNRTGYLVETQDEWVNVLSKLIEDADLRNRIAIAARHDVETRFAIEAVGPHLRKNIEAVASQHGRENTP